MTLADDLLAVARHLANQVDDGEDDDGLPALPSTLAEGAASRRSASTAYYAVFHRLVEVAIEQVMPEANDLTRNLAQRAITHTRLRKICDQLANADKKVPPKEWGDAFRLHDVKAPRQGGATYAVSPELRNLAIGVVTLHKQREAADYVPNEPFGIITAWTSMNAADRCFALIAGEIAEPQWQLFLASLLLRDRRPDRQE